MTFFYSAVSCNGIYLRWDSESLFAFLFFGILLILYFLKFPGNRLQRNHQKQCLCKHTCLWNQFFYLCPSFLWLVFTLGKQVFFLWYFFLFLHSFFTKLCFLMDRKKKSGSLCYTKCKLDLKRIVLLLSYNKPVSKNTMSRLHL